MRDWRARDQRPPAVGPYRPGHGDFHDPEHSRDPIPAAPGGPCYLSLTAALAVKLQGVTAAVCRVSRRETYMSEFCCCDFRQNSVRQRMENALDSAVGCVLSSQSCLPKLSAVPHVAIASSRAAPGPVQIRKLVSCLAIPCFRKRSPCCCHTRAFQYACSSSHDVAARKRP